MIAISEVFGPTVQGEGPSAGRLAAFVRLAACNLYCTWCDTPYTWDWTGKNGVKYDPKVEAKKRDLAEVIEWASTMHRAGVRLFVMTGGEPLLQRDALMDLANGLHAMAETHDKGAVEIEVETNGTQFPPKAIDVVGTITRWNVSPKLANSRIPAAERIVPDVLRAFVEGRRATFKFVCEKVEDLGEITDLADEVNIPARSIWVMPQARTAEELYARTRTLAPAAAARGWNFSSRIQLLAWGSARGH